MKYFDLHCDALTQEGVLQVTKEELVRGGCALQCFAAFVKDGKDRFRTVISLCDAFDELVAREGYVAVRTASDMGGGEPATSDMVCAMLTVENGGAVEGKIENLQTLYARGVRMMTLTWNYKNELGDPAFPDYGGYRAGRVPVSCRARGEGLTPFGFEAVERMKELGMIADVSHGSDRLLSDVFKTGVPMVASHSNADAVYPCARNLTDAGIRAVAERGGVVGLCFCADFLSADKTPAGQRAALLAHAAHILDAGGEDAPALGSDFDGTPPNPCVPSPSAVPALLNALEARFGARVAEKIAWGNARRMFSEFL